MRYLCLCQGMDWWDAGSIWHSSIKVQVRQGHVLQLISLSVSNPSSGPRMHDYAIHAGGAAG